MTVRKNIEKSFQSLKARADDLALINKLTQKELTAEDVYSFSIILCDNEVDRDFERFDTESLKTLEKMFVGKTGLYNHSFDAKDQTARLFYCELISDPAQKTATGEDYAYLKAGAYMPKTQKNADLISEIEAGIKKEVSISCSVKKLLCSVCAGDLNKGECRHKKGRLYEGKLCHGILKEPTDAYEWSFVAVPAQRAAGVTKAFCVSETEEGEMDINKIFEKVFEAGEALTEDERARLKAHIKALEEAGREAEAYREELIFEIIKMGKISLAQMPGESLTSICKRLSIGQLRELKEAFGHEACKTLPLKPQLAVTKRERPLSNNEFKI